MPPPRIENGGSKSFSLPISIDGKNAVAPFSTSSMKRKSTPWPHFACDWSTNSDNFCTLALGSFLPTQHNYVQVVTLPGRDSENFSISADALPIEYVATKLQWSPSRLKHSEYLAASGDGVYIWKVGSGDGGNPATSYTLTGRLVSRQTPRRASEDFSINEKGGGGNGGGAGNPPAPVTSFDWNKIDPTLIVTASYDTTCTVWCLESGSIKTQLIAHDKEVFDVSFSPVSVDTFVSVGADGSLRLFDIRYECFIMIDFISFMIGHWIIQRSFMKVMTLVPSFGCNGIPWILIIWPPLQ